MVTRISCSITFPVAEVQIPGLELSRSSFLPFSNIECYLVSVIAQEPLPYSMAFQTQWPHKNISQLSHQSQIHPPGHTHLPMVSFPVCSLTWLTFTAGKSSLLQAFWLVLGTCDSWGVFLLIKTKMKKPLSTPAFSMFSVTSSPVSFSTEHRFSPVFLCCRYACRSPSCCSLHPSPVPTVDRLWLP